MVCQTPAPRDGLLILGDVLLNITRTGLQAGRALRHRSLDRRRDTVQRRTKEIGIRKAMGATAVQVVGLLSKEFAQLIGLAGAVALPVAYVVMDGWLANFAYRTPLGVGLFLGALALTALVAFLAMGPQAVRAARLDPASTLKDE